MKHTEKLASLLLIAFTFCLAAQAIAAENATPKQILKATPGKVKEGIKTF